LLSVEELLADSYQQLIAIIEALVAVELQADSAAIVKAENLLSDLAVQVQIPGRARIAARCQPGSAKRQATTGVRWEYPNGFSRLTTISPNGSPYQLAAAIVDLLPLRQVDIIERDRRLKCSNKFITDHSHRSVAR
jgi:hypothetical protein